MVLHHPPVYPGRHGFVLDAPDEPAADAACAIVDLGVHGGVVVDLHLLQEGKVTPLVGPEHGADKALARLKGAGGPADTREALKFLPVDAGHVDEGHLSGAGYHHRKPGPAGLDEGHAVAGAFFGVVVTQLHREDAPPLIPVKKGVGLGTHVALTGLAVLVVADDEVEHLPVDDRDDAPEKGFVVEHVDCLLHGFTALSWV